MSEADAVILGISSEENSVAFYVKSEVDSYCFSLAILNSITNEYPIAKKRQEHSSH